MRNDGYINHLIEVMSLLSGTAGIDESTELCAAILHDAIEDTDATEAQISAEFGPVVLALVKALSDDKLLPLAARRAQTLAKLPSASPSVQRIKLADIISNVSSIPASWSQTRINEYVEWLDQIALLCRCSSEALYQAYIAAR